MRSKAYAVKRKTDTLLNVSAYPFLAETNSVMVTLLLPLPVV